MIYEKILGMFSNVNFPKFTNLQIFLGAPTRIAKHVIVGLQQAATFPLTIRLHNCQRVPGLAVGVKNDSTTHMASLQTAVHCVLDIKLASAGAFDCLLISLTHANLSQDIWFGFEAVVRYLLVQKIKAVKHTRSWFVMNVMPFLQWC